MDEPDDALATERRHLREAEARLRRLETLAAQGHYQSTDLTARLIDTMQHSLALARSHVARLERKLAKHPPI